VLLYLIMAGTLPFDEPNLPALFNKIARADYPVPTWFTPDMISVFNAMLNPNPQKR
jgi:carbon catabolite-derepressing protein kinase